MTSPTLTITQAHPADNGQYRLVVSNPLGGATSANATLTINADTTKPTVAYAAALPTPNPLGGPTPYLVRITFSELIDTVGSLTPGNYVFSGGVTVSQVTLGADNKTVYISTCGLTPGQKYSINISGVADQAQTPNIIMPATAWVWAPVTKPAWFGISIANIANGIANLTGSPYYPNAPYTNRNTLTFDSGEITGGDLNNRPGFVGIGENYGCSLSGWITPTVTTNYYFYLASDDASELYLSADANPANVSPDRRQKRAAATDSRSRAIRRLRRCSLCRPGSATSSARCRPKARAAILSRWPGRWKVTRPPRQTWCPSPALT